MDRKPIRVLLVDLRPVVTNALRTPLNPQWPRLQLVGHARSYSVALALAHELRPDVILFGVFPDPLDPFEAIGALSQGCAARILVLKSLYESVAVGKALDAGAHGVVPRDGSPELIGAAIAEAHDPPGPDHRGTSHGFLESPPLASWRLDPEQSRASQLTTREREVISAIAADPAAKYISIADRLGISEHTVHNHLSRIYHKLDVVNRIDLLVYAFRHGLADGEAPRHPGLFGAQGLAEPATSPAERAGSAAGLAPLSPAARPRPGAGTPRG